MTSADVELSPKEVTKEIMGFFRDAQHSLDPQQEVQFMARMTAPAVKQHIDGLHVLTALFQASRSRRLAQNLMPVELMLERLTAWDKEWNERDISAFVYGVRALECINTVDGELLKLGAAKIRASSAKLSSRAIGNALYGMQDITSDTEGAPELCEAMAEKISGFQGDLNGQDIGIGLYGMQGMSADKPQVRKLIRAMAEKIQNSVAELDEQALPNALYGLQVTAACLSLAVDLLHRTTTQAVVGSNCFR